MVGLTILSRHAGALRSGAVLGESARTAGEYVSERPGGRHEQILEVAARLFAHKGVAATTVREIADEVGILSGSLYHHFDSKEAMVDEILAPYLNDLREACGSVLSSPADPGARLRDLVIASLLVVEAHPHATEIYQSEANYLGQFERFGYLTDAASDVRSAWLEVISDGVSDGAFRSDLDPGILYRLMRDAIWLSVRWFRPTPQYPITRFAEDCTTLFLDGIAVPTPAGLAER
jgi:AcrR family transcriptional regulator